MQFIYAESAVGINYKRSSGCLSHRHLQNHFVNHRNWLWPSIHACRGHIWHWTMRSDSPCFYLTSLTSGKKWIQKPRHGSCFVNKKPRPDDVKLCAPTSVYLQLPLVTTSASFNWEVRPRKFSLQCTHVWDTGKLSVQTQYPFSYDQSLPDCRRPMHAYPCLTIATPLPLELCETKRSNFGFNSTYLLHPGRCSTTLSNQEYARITLEKL